MKKLALLLVAMFMCALVPYCLTAEAEIVSDYEYKIISKQVVKIDSLHRLLPNPARFDYPDYMELVTDKFSKAFDTARAAIPEAKFYVYFVDSPGTMPWTKDITGDSAAYEYIKSRMNADAYDHLKFTGAEQMFDMFYTTDHHWNYKGSYQGYLDIVNLLGKGDDDVLVPAETVTFDCIFNGSLASEIKEVYSEEYFTVYRFDNFPTYTSRVNGKIKDYNRMELYLAGKYTHGTYTNHYSYYYGGDNGEVLFTTGETGKGSLLIIGDSYSNAVKTMLLHHYDTILYVDLRHYHDDMGEWFSLSKTMQKYGITDVLVLSAITMYTDTVYLY